MRMSLIVTLLFLFRPVNTSSSPLALAGRWHGGRMASVAVVDGTQITYKHSAVNEGWLEAVPWTVSGVGAFGADIDGDGRDDSIVYADGIIFIRYASGTTEQRTIPAGRSVFAADFNADGRSEPGTYDPATRTLYYPDGHTEVRSTLPVGVVGLGGKWDASGPTVAFFNPQTGDLISATGLITHRGQGQPLAADFDGDGITDFGLYQSGTVRIWSNEIAAPATVTYQFGQNGDLPTTGRWTGSVLSLPGVYRPSDQKVHLYTGQVINASSISGMVSGVISGDWWGEGLDRPGLFVAPNLFYLYRSNGTWASYTCGTVGGMPFAGKFLTVSGYGVYNRHEARVELCRVPGATHIDFYYGKTDNDWLPVAGDWDGDGVSGFGLYEPAMGRFHLSDTTAPPIQNATFVFGKSGLQPLTVTAIAGHQDVGVFDANNGLFSFRQSYLPGLNERSFTFNMPMGNNQLREYGYYNVDGRQMWDKYPRTFISEVQGLNNSTLVHCYPQFYTDLYFAPGPSNFLNQARSAHLRVIMNVTNIFVDTTNDVNVEHPDWRERLNYYANKLGPYLGNLEAFYFDEPIEIKITLSRFQAYTSAIRQLFPSRRIIVIESASQIINGNLTASYLENVTDIGIDWYYTDPVYKATRMYYLDAYRNFKAIFLDKRHWVIAAGYYRNDTQHGTNATDLVDAIDLAYGLAKDDTNTAGILSFTYPSYAIPSQIGLEDMLNPDSPYYSANLRTTHIKIGQLVRSNRPHTNETVGFYYDGQWQLGSQTVNYQPVTGNTAPIIGDWNGNGVDTPGLYDRLTGRFWLTDIAPTTAYTLVFGNPFDLPLSGRWDYRMNHDGIGVYRESNGIVYLKRDLTTGYDDYFMIFGNPGDRPISADWDGDGFDSLGIYRPVSGDWYLTNYNGKSIVYSDEMVHWLAESNGQPIGGKFLEGSNAVPAVYYADSGTIVYLNGGASNIPVILNSQAVVGRFGTPAVSSVIVPVQYQNKVTDIDNSTRAD